jgi:hypothetical protein
VPWSNSTCIRLCSVRLKALLGMFENRFDLLPGYSGKPGQELVNGCPTFQIFKESSHRHARPAKYPRAADFARNTFDCRAGRPIQHDSEGNAKMNLEQRSARTLAGFSGISDRECPILNVADTKVLRTIMPWTHIRVVLSHGRSRRGFWQTHRAENRLRGRRGCRRTGRCRQWSSRRQGSRSSSDALP